MHCNSFTQTNSVFFKFTFKKTDYMDAVYKCTSVTYLYGLIINHLFANLIENGGLHLV